VVRHRLAEDHATHPHVNGKGEMTQRLDEGSLVVGATVNEEDQSHYGAL
jgi:hypothetical protein